MNLVAQIDLSILKKIIKNLHNAKILVIGDIMLDHYVEGHSERISPEAPIPIVRVKKEEFKLGGAGNVAKNMSTLGAKVTIISTVGKDPSANKLRQLLKKEKINHNLVEVDKPTTVKKRIISMNQHLLRIDYENSEPTLTKNILSTIKKEIKKCDAIILSDYSKGCITENLIKFVCKNSKCTILVDPKQPSAEFYKNVSIITPNEREAIMMASKNCKTLFDVAKDIEKKSKSKVLITRGENGMSFLKKNSLITIPTIAEEAYDVTGAGDTVISILALSIASGAEFEEAVFLANQAAGIVVKKFGTNAVSKNELFQTFEEKIKKIKTQEQIAIESYELKKKGKTVVFTNGCFDILHVGHVNIMQRAKKLGDILILGLNSDASIKRLKGKERPIINERERAELLAALEVVDYITFFDDDTPVNIIKKIKPNIHVKGGDYNKKDMPETKIVEKYGGEVVILPFVKGFSTTNILNKIKNNTNKK